MTYTRLPSEESGSGSMDFDGIPMRINRVTWWPKVGQRSWVWTDDPKNPVFFEQYRINSAVRSIERLREESGKGGS